MASFYQKQGATRYRVLLIPNCMEHFTGIEAINMIRKWQIKQADKHDIQFQN
jgi:hypothetical protein